MYNDSMEEEGPRRPALKRIVQILCRRKEWIIAITLVVFSLSAYLAFSLPDTYRSSTLLLVSPQRLPRSYITSTLTQTAQERIYGITQQILSRTNLEKIIKQFNLYVSARWATMEDRVEELRKKIRINVQADQSGARRAGPQDSTAFVLSFDAETPDKATQVTARLAALFIDENIRLREQEATGTTNFINTEAERIRKDLEQQEAEVNRYKAEHRFELPEQLDANVKNLEQLRTALENHTVRLVALRERRADLEKQILNAETPVPKEPKKLDQQNAAEPLSIEDKKEQLKVLLGKYSAKHPDIIRLKQEIEVLEKEEPAKKDTTQMVLNPKTPVGQMLRRQVGEAQIEIHSLETTIESLRDDIAGYKRRIDNTPLREIEFSKISRNYQITLKKYQDMLAKGLDSQLSENMEKQQKGEQFQLLDPASVPQKPLFPNRPLILLGGFFGGLAAGFLLALQLDNSDTSIKKGDVVKDLPLLAMLPQIASRRSVLEKRRTQGLLAFASIGFIAIGVAIIHWSVPLFFY